MQVQSEQPLGTDSATCCRGGVANAEGAESWDAWADLLSVAILVGIYHQAIPSCH